MVTAAAYPGCMSSILSIGIADAGGGSAVRDGCHQHRSRWRLVERGDADTAAVPEVDLASSMVALKLASYDFGASAKIVEVRTQMSRSVLDILA